MLDRILIGFRLFIFIVIFEALCSRAQRPHSDDLYILIDEISVFSCRGGKLLVGIKNVFLDFSLFGKIMKNGAFFVFTTTSESL